jgi:hypothetical protein
MPVRAPGKSAPPKPDASVSLEKLPADVRAKAPRFDQFDFDSDGRMSRTELEIFRGRYGGDPNYRQAFEILDQEMAAAESPPSFVPDPAVLARALKLVKPGGSADDEDVRAVAIELAKLPPAVLARMEQIDVKVVACRESITDHRTDLKGVQPRGWPPGATWDNVPGVYLGDERAAVIATRDDGAGHRRVPPTGDGHGSFNVVLHELGHGLDDRDAFGEKPGDEKSEFRKAYDADLQSLRDHHEDYLLQAPPAGPEEAWAESFAMAYGGDSELTAEMPHIAAYWLAAEKKLEGGGR